MERSAILTKTERREVYRLLLTRLPITEIAEILHRSPSCISTVAVRWYRVNDCKTRDQLMAQEILRLKEKVSELEISKSQL